MYKGRLPPHLRQWGLDLCDRDPVSCRKFVTHSPFGIFANLTIGKSPPTSKANFAAAQASDHKASICAQLNLPKVCLMTVEGDSVDDLERQTSDAKQLSNGALNALSKAETDVQKLRQSRVSETVAQHPLPAVVATEHRRLHRSGRPPKIDTDPELQAFLLARVDRHTFEEMAQDVTDHFSPARRVGKSSIHLW